MATSIGNEYDHIDFTRNGLTMRHPFKDATSRQMVGDIVRIQDQQPQLEHNKIWIKQTPNTEVQVPTYAEFEEIMDAYNALEARVAALEAIIGETI